MAPANTDADTNGDSETKTLVSADAVSQGGTITDTITTGGYGQDIEISLRNPEAATETTFDREIPVQGEFGHSVFTGVLKQIEPQTMDEDGGYILEFDDDVLHSGWNEDVRMSRASAVRISEVVGDEVFTAVGEDDLSTLRSEATRTALVVQAEYMSKGDEELRQELADAIGAELPE